MLRYKQQQQQIKYLLQIVMACNKQQKPLCWWYGHEPLSGTLRKFSLSGYIILIQKHWNISLLPSGKILRYCNKSTSLATMSNEADKFN